MKPFSVVPMQVARNPVARLYADMALKSAIKAFQTRLYLLNEGEDCRGDCIAAMQVMAVLMECFRLSDKWGTPEAKVIRGGMSCLVQIANRGFSWKTIDAPAIDGALSRCVELYRVQPAKLVQRAWANVERTNRKIEQEVEA